MTWIMSIGACLIEKHKYLGLENYLSSSRLTQTSLRQTQGDSIDQETLK